MKDSMRFYHSIYFKLTALFGLVLIVVSIWELYLASRGFRDFAARIHQELEWGVAAHIAAEVQPALLAKHHRPAQAIELLLPYALANPKLEFYILDSRGTVLAFRNRTNLLRTEKVRLEPIETAIQDIAPSLPLYGSDPARSGHYGADLLEREGRVFSVAPLYFNGKKGYLYIIIEGVRYSILIRQGGQFFITRMMTFGWLITVLGLLALAYGVYQVLSRRFAHIRTTVQEYAEGDYSRALSIQSNDEIGILSRSLNEMAARLISAKQEIEDRDLRRRELIANLSHDLRSPLQSLLLRLEKIAESEAVAGDETLNAEVKKAERTLHMQNRLIEDLFELAKLEAKAIEPSIDAIALESLIQESIDALQLRADEQGVSLALETDGEVLPALVDPAYMNRVCTNLLENALRHTPAGGTIKVLLQYREDRVHVSVCDTGEGMRLEDQDKVLERFKQLDSQANREHRGAGLGLSIVKRILELHDSKLELESALGKGSRFFFSLPLEEAF